MTKLASTTLFLIILSTQVMFGQRYNQFLDGYTFHKNCLTTTPTRDNKNYEYQDIEGEPYLNREFQDGIIYLKDTTAYKMLLRYNIYKDVMEYQLNGVNYLVGDQKMINKIMLDSSTFVYLPFIKRGGYFELLVMGKCTLVQKRTVSYAPAEGAKPIVATPTPARFIPDSDTYYLVWGNSTFYEIKNMKTLIAAFPDQQSNIESFIKTEKIRKASKKNLIKVVTYYNSGM